MNAMLSRADKRGVVAALAVCTVVLAAVTLSGCGPKLAEQAKPVQTLLELRSDVSTDTAAYERVLESTEVAAVLAQDAANAPKADSPVPPWEVPTVEESSETSAVVVVTWKPTADYKDWPEATRFIVKKVDGRWVVSDAVEQDASEETSGTAGAKEESATP